MSQSDFRAALLRELETGWAATARPNQLPPPGHWFCWLLLAGRGFGKTRSICEFLVDNIASGAAKRAAVVAATAADARDVLAEGQSGVLAISPPYNRPLYEPSKRRLTWPNGAIATLYSADEPERLRGPQHDLAICDELASWRRPEAWSNLLFGLRLGERPRIAVATTPRPTRLIRELLAREGTDVVVTRGTSYENRQHHAPEFFRQIVTKYEGTRLGRQELLAEVLTDTPGQLWNIDELDALRRDVCPPLRRVVVAVDPSGSGDPDADECGIVVAGLADNGHGYVLADLSGRYSPLEWARIAVEACHAHRADRVIAETNFGGGLVEATLRAVDPNLPYRGLTASRGKAQRAEPIAALFEQSRVFLLGKFPQLEDELCAFTSAGYTGGGSPNRADAMVWAITDLMVREMSSYGVFEYYRQRAAEIAAAETDDDEDDEAPSDRPSVIAPVADWRRRYDRLLTRPTPSHPDLPETDPEKIEHVNGCGMKSEYARGSLEWQRQQQQGNR
jgi:phage terminase large subunit-like protein